MKSDISTKLATETAYFSQLIADIKKGEIKIPQFQRKFVWKDDQALDLLDSVANRYPIGSVLLWKTVEKLNAARDIGSFRLPTTDEITPTNYVLDGQQRLTVMYSCLGASESEGGYTAAYDLVNEIFIEIKGPISRPEIFPLRKMFNTTSLLNYRTSLLNLPNAAILQERLDDIISAFTQYKLPVVTLKDLTIEEVCPIFERINSSGTRLSTYDLMVAATWAEDFDLNEKVASVLSALDSKGYGSTERSTILKALSAVHSGSIQDKSLRELRNLSTVQIESLAELTESALRSAVDALSTQFLIHSWDFLSYEAVLLVATYIFRDAKELSALQANRLRQWFWRASFGERYKIGGENFVSRDLEVVKAYVLSGDGNGEQFGLVPNSKDWGNIQFKSNVSRSRSYILALASAAPRNLANGMSIDVQSALSGYNKKEYHHVYPRAYLKAIGEPLESNALGNIVMLTSTSNKTISDSPPSKYVPVIVAELGKDADAVFISNLLPKPSSFNYKNANYSDFLAARGKIISDHVAGLIS
ncbi:GmrSD restriction endonuclease domain-containing protein [Nitrospira sp. Ecomares 2.1]